MIPPARPGLKLSIVIAAWNGNAALDQCLRSLGSDGQRADTEVVVVTNYDGGTNQMLLTGFPYVQHVCMPQGTTVPMLRTRGIFHSAGEIVALAEDHCTFGANWCAELKKAHELPFSAIGGPVENGSANRALDWAVYFYDYGKFMPPRRAGVVDSLSGNNVSYKRAVLREVESSFRDGFYEPFTHGEIAKRGEPLYLAPAVVVYHQKSYVAKHAIAQAYHLARSFAGKRFVGTAREKRGMFAAGSLALPILLPGRIVFRTIRKGRHIPQLLRSLGYLLLLTASWSFGEFCGYIAGEGRSASEWK
jgi:GT2 family glycosyltransferase